MTGIRSIKDEVTQSLSSYYSVEEAESIARRLLEAAYGQSYPMLVIMPPKDTQIREGWKMIEDWMRRLLAHEPLQYLLGFTDFDGLRVQVSPGVLIPRPETEYLCALIRERFAPMASKKPHIQAIDVCTGSGCIALSLARSFANADVEALDWSEQALAVSRTNIDAHPTLSDRLHLIKADVLSETFTPPSTGYDLVVSNPPYVLERERREISPHVLEHEPEMALFVSDDTPLLFYEAILKKFAPLLSSSGLLAFEINQALGKETVALCTKTHGLQAVVIPDQYGRDRFVFATPYTSI